ncbi:hypothetical protein GIB67_034119 [Kingdonia uniflora]|uniref:Uncharacterized protein n=1 Tax=Kingdonia uniflora TaxID=39325 RepID=A0A7J7NCU8_9MAGN|nr:hypothetical protein GIB67_034119 [Kingdonia uniflora]
MLHAIQKAIVITHIRPGYRCSCFFSEGNPYLLNGCLDPCDDPNYCGEGYVCISEITRSYASLYCQPEAKAKVISHRCFFHSCRGGVFL